MNRIYHICLLALGLILFNSCEKSALSTFDSTAQIYFYDPEPYTGKLRDSTLLSFARLPLGTKETTIELPMAYIGKVSEIDRPYRVVIDQEKTTAEEGKHYELLPGSYNVFAGASSVKLPVKLISSPDLDNKMVQLVLRLEKNDNFDIKFSIINTDLNPIGLSTYRVLISNMLLKPSWWNSSADSYLGHFSRAKVELIEEVTGKNLDYLELSVTKYDWDALKVIARECQIHINYKRSINEELLDENKLPLNMGSYVN